MDNPRFWITRIRRRRLTRLAGRLLVEAADWIRDPHATRSSAKTMKPGHVKPGTAEKLGAKLERDRLTWRARRVTAVIAALRRQAGEPHARNRHIHQAITEFEAEVAAIHARLSDLAAGATPAHAGATRHGIGR
jgi:hypothetical protein